MGVTVRGLHGVVGAIACAFVIAGCSGGSTISPSPSGEAERAFHEEVVRARAEAETQGADEAQLAILDEALTSNAISLEDAQQALNDYGDCLADVGFALHDVKVIDDAGFKTLDYTVRGGEDTTLMDACDAKTFLWVNRLYQMQPAATRARDADFEDALPGLIACLQAGGVPVDDNSPADEVKQVMFAFWDEHALKRGDPGVTENYDGSLSSSQNPFEGNVVLNCLGQAGIDGL
jgi:hypothetical protein